MGELGVRIDTPISALLTLKEEEFCCFSFRIHRFSRSFTLFAALSTHTHAYARTRALRRSQLAERAAVAVGQGLAGAASASSAAPDAQRDEGGEEAPAEERPLLG